MANPFSKNVPRSLGGSAKSPGGVMGDVGKFGSSVGKYGKSFVEDVVVNPTVALTKGDFSPSTAIQGTINQTKAPLDLFGHAISQVAPNWETPFEAATKANIKNVGVPEMGVNPNPMVKDIVDKNAPPKNAPPVAPPVAPVAPPVAPTPKATQIGELPDAYKGATIERFPGTYGGAKISAIDDADPVTVCTMGIATAAEIQQEQQAQFRQKQLDLIEALQSTEKTPEQLQLERSSEKAMASQLAAAQMRGGALPASLRTAAGNIANIQQSEAEQSAILGAQQRQSQQALTAQIIGGAREQDIDVAGAQARLTQEAAIQNAEAKSRQALAQGDIDRAISIANQSTAAQSALEQARLEQQAGLNERSIETDRATEEARFAQQAGIAAQQQATAKIMSQAELDQQMTIEAGRLGISREELKNRMDLGILDSQTRIKIAKMEAKAAKNSGAKQLLGGITSAIGTVGGAYLGFNAGGEQAGIKGRPLERPLGINWDLQLGTFWGSPERELFNPNLKI